MIYRIIDFTATYIGYMMQTPSIWQDAMTWVPQMQSDFDPSTLMQSEPPKEGK